MTSLICNACQIQILSDEERAAHYKSEWHRYNVKRRCAGLASIPQQLFDAQLTALNKKKAAETAQKLTQNCKTCKKTFATASAYHAHIASKKHLKKVEKQGEGEADSDDEEAADDASPIVGKSASAGESKEVEDDEEMKDGEEDDVVEEEEEGEPIPLLHCLFCSKKDFPDLSSSVDHMLKQHGFFIPFIENLVDLEGMLTYLGEKIGVGHVCLWCNGVGRARYPSTHAVQAHMAAKSHCKIALETDADEEEFMDYYDFDLDEEEEESADGSASSPAAASSSSNSSALIVKEESKRAGGGGAAGINDAGELVLADGSIVGSRQLKHIYKQHVRPSRDLVAIAEHYKQLALNTNVKQENPRIYRRKREAFHLRARKREDLAKGLAGNVQHHFRAQVSF